MRFKAKLAPEQLALLSQLVAPLARIAGASTEGWTRNGSILYLDRDRLRLCVRGRTNDTDNVRCFADLAARDGIFLEHRIESAAANDAIVLEVDLMQFRIALQSLAVGGGRAASGGASALESAFGAATTIHVKLAKRNGIPCLCFDALTRGAVQVCYSLPVRVLRPADMQQHLPPPVLSTATMRQLELPRDRPFRSVLEGLRPLSGTVVLRATARGELTVTVDADGATIQTFYSQLPVVELPQGPPPRGGEGSAASSSAAPPPPTTGPPSVCVKVDTKKLVACLQWHWSAVSSARICLMENEMVLLHLRLYPREVGSLSYYIPVHYLSPDDYAAYGGSEVA